MTKFLKEDINTNYIFSKKLLSYSKNKTYKIYIYQSTNVYENKLIR